MDKKIILIPDDLLDYLEGLWYQLEGYKLLIRHLSIQNQMNQTIIEDYTNKYVNLFTEYNMALNQIVGTYAKEEIEQGYNVVPVYATGTLLATRGMCCNEKICSR